MDITVTRGKFIFQVIITSRKSKKKVGKVSSLPIPAQFSSTLLVVKMITIPRSSMCWEILQVT